MSSDIARSGLSSCRRTDRAGRLPDHALVSLQETAVTPRPHSSAIVHRIAVLRTSRFLPVTVAAARARWPAATVRAAYQHGAEDDVRAAGIEPDPQLALPAGHLGAGAFVRTRAFRRLLAWRPDVVIVQWWNPRGEGHEAADRAALLLLAPVLTAGLEDGTLIDTTWMGRACRPWTRAARGLILMACMFAATLAAVPAYLYASWRERESPGRP